MFKDANGRRNLRNICLLAAGASVALVANYVKRTTEILSNAFDSSILDVYDEQDCAPQRYHTPNWIMPKHPERNESLLHRITGYVKFKYAERLVSLAQSDNEYLRLRAIKQLTSLKLNDWQCSLIAHMCDARMAVAIARSLDAGQDSQKYFLPISRTYCAYNNQLLLHTIKDYMYLLYKASGNTPHACLQKTVSKISLHAYDINRIIDNDHGSAMELSYVGKDTEDVLPLCLETVRHHSAITHYTKHILNHKGLYLLMEVHHRYPNDPNINIPLCQIMTNISTHPELLQEMFKSGWISVLAKWVHHPDVRLSGPASQALANLDQDAIRERYSSNIFLLHPKMRKDEKVLVDVVFVHGLLGSVFYTWRNGRSAPSIDLVGKHVPQVNSEESIGLEDSKCEENILSASSDPAVQEYLMQMAENEKEEWDNLGNDYEFVQFDIPEYTNAAATGPYVCSNADVRTTCDNTQCWARDWLPADCGHLRVLGVNYATSLSLWAHMCPEISVNATLEDRSTELMEELTNAGVGKRPIVWVGHSMGGLLVKNVISKALKSDNPDIRNLATESKAIFFYSTPHCGSKTAILNQTTSYLVWPSMDVQELREDSPNLQRIHNEFLDYLRVLPIEVYSFVENKPTIVSALKLNIEVVAKKSANPGVGEYYEIPLNHLGICKPTNRESFLYQKVLQEIRKVVAVERSNSTASA